MALLTFLAGLALALHEPDRRTIAVAGATRAYLMEGAAEGSGPVYIALHPRPADGAAMRWISGLSAVAADGGTVIYPDGIGGEWNPAGPDHAFLDALVQSHGEGRPVVLVGVSNGADMALAYAAARPARLSALVLVSGGAGPEAPAPAVIPPPSSCSERRIRTSSATRRGPRTGAGPAAAPPRAVVATGPWRSSIMIAAGAPGRARFASRTRDTSGRAPRDPGP